MIKQHNCTSRKEKQEADRYSGLPLILLLMLLTLVTSGIAGFILGNRSGTPSLGQIIDTILLSPDLPPAEETIHLTGRVFYTDGMPAASRSMELHSNPLSTVTNSDGGFLFSGVPEGALLLQQPGRNGGIDTAGHADDYFFCGFRHWITHDIELQGGVFYHAAF